MLHILIISAHQREAEVLNLAFSQRGFRIHIVAPSQGNYLQVMQYRPDALMLEFPVRYLEQVTLVRLLKKNASLGQLPIMGLGNHNSDFVIQNIKAVGVKNYFQRPLKFGPLMDALKELFEKEMDEMAKRMEGKESASMAGVAQLLDSEVNPELKIQIILDNTGRLQAMPFAAGKIVMITEDGSSGAGDLSKAVAADSSISATILKVANSVAFATRGNRIATLKDAIVRLGFNEVKNIAMSLEVMKIFDSERKTFGFDRTDFWYQNLVCAITASKVAQAMGIANTSMAFLTGLLHEFGILILDEFFSDAFYEILKKGSADRLEVGEAEKEIMGIMHTEFVSPLFEKWKFPKAMIDAIENQYDFQNPPGGLPEESQKLLTCLGVSRMLARTINLGASCDQVVYNLSGEMLKAAGLGAGIRPAFFDSIIQGSRMYAEFLATDARMPQEFVPISENSDFSIVKVNYSKDLLLPYALYLECISQNFIHLPNYEAFEGHLQENSADLLLLYCDEEWSEDLQSCVDMAASNEVAVALFVPAEFNVENVQKSGKIEIIKNREDMRRMTEQILLLLGHGSRAEARE